MIATAPEMAQELLRLGLPAESANMHYVRKVTDFMGNKIENPKWSVPKYGNPDSKHANYIVQNFTEFEVLPAWSLSALLEVMPKPDLYRETADLWVCVTFFKEGSIRGFGETNIEAACDVITKMFGKGYLIKKGGNK